MSDARCQHGRNARLCPTCEALAALAASQAEVSALKAETEALRNLLHRDRTGLAASLEACMNRARAGRWITEGRGSYEWNDDEYRKETGHLITQIIGIAQNGLNLSGKLADTAFHPDRNRAVLEASRSQIATAHAEVSRLTGELAEAEVTVGTLFMEKRDLAASLERAWAALTKIEGGWFDAPEDDNEASIVEAQAIARAALAPPTPIATPAGTTPGPSEVRAECPAREDCPGCSRCVFAATPGTPTKEETDR